MGKKSSYREIFLTALKLGLTSFGGPSAHLGYFQNEYVQKKKWLDHKTYADLIALCQFLPGPASSQVGIGIGYMRGGALGGFLAWLGFTAPSVIILVVFSYFLETFSVEDAGWLSGLKVVASSVVALAVFEMWKKLAPDVKRASFVLFATIVSLLFPYIYTQVGIIIVSGLAGIFLLKTNAKEEYEQESTRVSSRKLGMIFLVLFFTGLILLPVLHSVFHQQSVQLFDSMYRAGSLVFGGGHVVLPLLESEFVKEGWLTKEEFLAGYGVTQAVPGPLFTFAAFIGTEIGRIWGAVLATVGIFLPSFLLVVGILPFWEGLRKNRTVQKALLGINAAVVGLLLAALYDPIWTSSILSTHHFIIAFINFVLLAFYKMSPWKVVFISALLGQVLL
jgi:chromate transporter